HAGIRFGSRRFVAGRDVVEPETEYETKIVLGPAPAGLAAMGARAIRGGAAEVPERALRVVRHRNGPPLPPAVFEPVAATGAGAPSRRNASGPAKYAAPPLRVALLPRPQPAVRPRRGERVMERTA